VDEIKGYEDKRGHRTRHVVGGCPLDPVLVPLYFIIATRQDFKSTKGCRRKVQSGWELDTCRKDMFRSGS
jgi:hypothetical protein